MSRIRLAPLFAIPILLGAAATPSDVHFDTDACTLLTPAQVGAAIGGTVGAGTHVAPNFVKTCTWVEHYVGSTAGKIVTLNLNPIGPYDERKQTATQEAGMVKGAAVTPGGVGDDSFYFVQGPQVSLDVKKGATAFKIWVYAQIPINAREAMELTLAKDVLAKL
jgi:hypothetical protein